MLCRDVVAAVVGRGSCPTTHVADCTLGSSDLTWRSPRDGASGGCAGAAADRRALLVVGVSVVSLSAAIGITVGAVAGYAGRWIDEVAGRLMDVLLAFPGILLAIALVAVLGPSLANVVIALVAIGWVGYARLVRGQVLKLRELEYVQALARWERRSPRAPRHVLPGALPAVACRRHSAAGVILS